MIVWITDQEQLLKDRDLVDQFFTLYEHQDNFPDKNEREEPAIIKQRILDHSNNPNTNLLVYKQDEAVRGGAIVEYYPRSECCLITYLFVSKRDRRSGIAKNILVDNKEEGIPGFVKYLEKEGKRIKAVLFETNNPLSTNEDDDSILPYERLKFFSKVGAKLIDFDYVQPSLDDQKAVVDNLYLCLIPDLADNGLILEIRVILQFLTEFYHSLEALNGDYDTEFEKASSWQYGFEPHFSTPALNRMCNSLSQNDYGNQGFTYLKQLPRIEEPRLLFHRASVCFELLIDETYFQPYVLGEAGEKTRLRNPPPGKSVDPLSYFNSNIPYCNITHSFETDLFAYAYQAEQPYYTRSFNFARMHEVIIRFPQCTEFTSEGRQETLYVLPRTKGIDQPQVKTLSNPTQPDKEVTVKEIRLKVFLNYTYFFNSEIRVWHLVFAASDHHSIDEIDLIKLMKFFSGSQESKSETIHKKRLDSIKFVDPKNPKVEMNLTELFSALSGIEYTAKLSLPEWEIGDHPISAHGVHTGIVAIDTKFCSFMNDLYSEEGQATELALIQLFKNLKNNEEGRKVSSADVETQYQSNKNAEFVFETFCGITLGIFDYDRMSFEEVSDTLIPRSATESSFLTINRGVLSSFGYDDDVLSASFNNLGINPYLIIPSAVLAHNEYIANDGFRQSIMTLEKVRANQKAINIRRLENMRQKIRSLINIDFLPNVFQYPTEQDLYNYGMRHRGVLEKIQRTKANLEQLDDVISESNAQLNHRYQFWVNILLMIISIFQIYEVVANLIIELSRPAINLNPTIIKLIVLIFLIIICTLIAMRLYRRSGIERNQKFIVGDS